MNPLAIAVQGLGYGAALVAAQGLLAYVVQEVQNFEQSGGDSPARRKTRRAAPNWLPAVPVEEDEALLLIGIL